MLKYSLQLILFFLLGISYNIFAQKEKDTLFDKNSKTFVPVPIISNNPAMKTGFGGMAMYFFKLNKNDTVSPPSLFTLAGLYSTNNSYYLVPAIRTYFKEDKYRASLIAGTFRVNNDYSFDTDEGDISLVYSDLRNFLSAEFSRKVIGDFYIGLIYLGVKTRYKFDQGTDEENEFAEAFFKENEISDNFISSVGLNFSYDSRDYIYNPSKGFMFSIRPKLNRTWLGSENDYVDTDYKFSYFTNFNPKNILAFNLAGGFATGDVPFDGYQSFGARNSLRGYQTGKYKGRMMVALQGEYRWNFYNRWGSVLFAGTGSVWGTEEAESFFERKWLPSAGLGLRYMISREKKINLRLDYAVGVDGNHGLYFGVMEAF